jgi:hypothetical protein
MAPGLAGDFLDDVERLFRLNPQLAIERWEPAAGGFRLVGQNESNGRSIDTIVRIDKSAGSLALRYAGGLKRATRFVAEPVPEGTRLVVTEYYPRLDDARDPRVAEVDRSLVPWVAAIRRHLRARVRWGWLPGWRWWNERLLPGMAPRQRRIVRLIIWASAVEFAIFLGLVVVWRLSV